MREMEKLEFDFSTIQTNTLTDTTKKLKKRADELSHLREKQYAVFRTTLENEFEDFFCDNPYLFKKVISGDDISMYFEWMSGIQKMQSNTKDKSKDEKKQAVAQMEKKFRDVLAEKHFYPNLTPEQVAIAKKFANADTNTNTNANVQKTISKEKLLKKINKLSGPLNNRQKNEKIKLLKKLQTILEDDKERLTLRKELFHQIQDLGNGLPQQDRFSG